MRPANGKWLLDLGIAAVLLGGLLAWVSAYLDLHRYDALVDATLEELRVDGATLIAAPWSMRSSVPRLLAGRVTPVLYDPASVSPQGLGILGVEHVLAPGRSEREALAAVATTSREIEGTALIEFDAHSALALPLAPGRRVEWHYSRPYRYRPLRDCLTIASGERQEYDFTLAAGNYAVSIEAFAKQAGELELSILGDGVAESTVLELERIVHAPLSHPFRLDAGPDRSVRVAFTAQVEKGKQPALAYVHRVWLERVP